MKQEKTCPELLLEVEKLRAQFAEAEETLRAIRSGEVDALVVSGEKGEQVFTLKGAEQPYRILIEEMSEGAVMLAADDSILYSNSGFAGMLKAPLEKLIGNGIAQYIAPADEAVFRELLLQGREGSSRGEITLLAGDGTFISTHLSFHNLQIDDSRFVYLVATDLTERKHMEEALRRARDELEIRVEERTADLAKSEQRWATTLASIGDAVISTDVEGRITFMNAEAEALTGWKLAEASTRPVREVFNIINEYTRAEVEDPVSRVLQEGMIIGLANHTILVRKDGTEVPIDDSGAPIRDGDGMTMGVVLVFRDITGRKQAERELFETQQRLQALLQALPVGVSFSDDPTCQRITGNPAVLAQFEVGPEDNLSASAPNSSAPGRQVRYFRDGREISDAELPLQRAIAENQGIPPIELEIELPGGRRWFAEASGSPIRDSQGNVTGGVAVTVDITERKRAEESLQKAHDELELRVQERTAELKEANKALMESEASYRELTESIEDLFYAMDSDLRYTYWNRASEALTGIMAKDAIGKSLYELFPDVKGTKAEQFYIKSLKTRQPQRFESQFQIGGKKFIFEVNVYPTRTGLSVIAKNITEKKMFEAHLLRAQRMESIGILAGGIAHNLNNMLTPMMISLHMLKEKFKDDQSQKLLAILEKNSQRSADLIKQVLSFSRGIEGERVPLQAKHIITEIEKVAKETFPRNIEIRTDIRDDLFPISGDITQLHQVMMNLCVNARDALQDGGILSITASNFFIDENYARTHPEARVGPYVVIAVSDTGIGIPPEIMDRVFEPFFTTKEFGKGTGLGLSTALAIVKSHGGFINVYSEVGKGTTFRVYLPSIKTETQDIKEEQLELPIGQGELVLVAEDEDSIREVTVSTLEEYGYNALTAGDGAEAVALYAQNKDKIEVILMDMMMPVMDGHASIRAIRKINPGVRIIAVSGLAEKDKLAEIADTHVNAFLPKPYTTERLLKTIWEVIGKE